MLSSHLLCHVHGKEDDAIQKEIAHVACLCECTSPWRCFMKKRDVVKVAVVMQ